MCLTIESNYFNRIVLREAGDTLGGYAPLQITEGTAGIFEGNVGEYVVICHIHLYGKPDTAMNFIVMTIRHICFISLCNI